jgi:CRP/FNR family cyclic AMP-dependent transcriptional regulator
VTELADAQLPQVEMAMAERREVRDAGERLRQTPLFQGLSDAEAAALSTFVEGVAVEADTVIVRQGDEADALYVLQSGQVEVRLRSQDGGSKSVATIGTGGYFGEIGILTGGTRLADVVALEPTELLRLSKDDYERYLAEVVEIDQELGETAAARAADSARKLLG